MEQTKAQRRAEYMQKFRDCVANGDVDGAQTAFDNDILTANSNDLAKAVAEVTISMLGTSFQTAVKIETMVNAIRSHNPVAAEAISNSVKAYKSELV